MGHNRLPTLPASRSWQDVVELLNSSAPPAEVISQAATAAQRSFLSAADDPVYVEAVRILVIIAQAGRDKDVEPALRREGLDLHHGASLFDLLDAVSRRLEQTANQDAGTSDLGQLASRSLLSTLHSLLLAEMPGLFAEQPGDLSRAMRQFASPNGFSELARGFFTRMTAETMAYWLERSLGAHIGDPDERATFDGALFQFSAEATRIIREFSSGWYAKHAFRSERVPETTNHAYAAVAFKKINDELRRKTGLDD